MIALTSLSPAPDRVATQTAALDSWRAAGLEVRSFHYAAEVDQILARYPGVEIEILFGGGRYAPITAMLRWATEHGGPVLLINSDIELRLKPWELKRVGYLSSGGLCWFVRHNYTGRQETALKEVYGIDAFLMDGIAAALFPSSSFTMGQPFWDYWIPYVMAKNGKPLFSVEHAAALHRKHDLKWSLDSWHQTGYEFGRLTGELGDRTTRGLTDMSLRVRKSFDFKRRVIPPEPFKIRDWVKRTFTGPRAKTFIELGAHDGSDTAWLAALRNVAVYAVEPDPRNNPPLMLNAPFIRAAISDKDGTAPFILSGLHDYVPGDWTHSSSLRTPTGHLTKYPQVTFGDTIQVETITLDTLCRGMAHIDLIWADVQGAEGDMIRGGREALARTRYLYTEYSDVEMYAGQVTLDQILEMLPGWRVVELWEEDVLLENTTCQSG